MADNEKEVVKTGEDPKSESKKSEKKAAKEKKPSFFKKIGKFFKDLWSERKKIVWFSRKQTINSTLLVVVSIVISSIVISLLDFGFSNAIMALGKLI